MKALITGGGGFCGQHLLHYLRKQSVEVFTMAPRAGAQDHYQIASVDDVEGMTSAIRESRPDFIFHLAGIAWCESPSLLYRVNVEYAAELLKATERADRKGIPILLVGTAAEYGLVSAEDLPVSEDYPPRPYNHHGISKFAQTLAGLAAAEAGHRVVIVRPGNIVGAGMPRHLLLGRIAEEIHRIARDKQEPRIPVGNLQMARDFIDVADVAEIYWSLIRNDEAYGEVVNVCSGKAIPVRTLVDRLITLSGVQVELIPQPDLMRTHDPAVYAGCINKLRRLIDRVPSFEMDKSLTSILHGAGQEQ